MIISRPYEATLGRKKPKYKFSKIVKTFLVENLLRPGRDWIPAGRGSLNRSRGGQERAKEGQIKGHLDPKIGPNLRTKKFPDWPAAQPCT